MANPIQAKYIPKKDLPTGILHITAISYAGVPYAERLVFINQKDYLNIQLTSNQIKYRKREKVIVDILTTDKQGNPIPANLSLAVIDANKVPVMPYSENIKTHLLLTADLRGSIYAPDYYFQHTEASEKALDELLMTQGWRRFKWKELLKQELNPIKYPIEQTLTINGVVEGAYKKIKNGSIVGLLPNKSVLTTDIDEKGNFSLTGFDFYDTMTVVLQARNAKNKDNVSIKLENKEKPAVTIPFLASLPTIKKETTDKYVAVAYQQSKSETMLRMKKGEILLDEVEVIGKKNILNPEYRQKVPIPYGIADKVITAAQIEKTPVIANDLFMTLRGVISILQVIPSSNAAVPNEIMLGRATSSNGLLVLLDGAVMDMTDAASYDIIKSLLPQEIEAVEVVRRETNVGGRYVEGVIAIYTKQMQKKTPSSIGLLKMTMKGYDKVREFYSPNYEADPIENIPDLRTTVFWQPIIKTGQDGKAVVSFYTADMPTNYLLQIEGMTNGKTALVGKQLLNITVE